MKPVSASPDAPGRHPAADEAAPAAVNDAAPPPEAIAPAPEPRLRRALGILPVAGPDVVAESGTTADQMTLIEHLVELRHRIFICAIAVVVARGRHVHPLPADPDVPRGARTAT